MMRRLDNLRQRIQGVGHQGWVWNVSFSQDGAYVATASDDKSAKVYDLKSKDLHFQINHQHIVRNVSFSHDGVYVATASYDNSAKVYDLKSKDLHFQIDHQDTVRNVSFSPDGAYVATASDDKSAKVYDLKSKDLHFQIDHQDMVRNVSFSQDGAYVATASYDNSAKVYDLKSKDLHFQIGHQGMVWNVSFSQDGAYVATASHDKSAKVYDLTSKDLHFQIDHQDPVRHVSFSQDGAYVATASNSAKVYDLKSKDLHFQIDHQDIVLNVSFSQDGAYVATASYDKSAKVYDFKSKDLHFQIDHRDRVRNVSFSQDGAYVATASDDKSAKVYDLHTGTAYFLIDRLGLLDFFGWMPLLQILATMMQVCGLAFLGRVPWNRPAVEPIARPMKFTVLEFDLHMMADTQVFVKAWGAVCVAGFCICAALIKSRRLAVLVKFLSTLLATPVITQLVKAVDCYKGGMDGLKSDMSDIVCFQGYHLLLAIMVGAVGGTYLMILLPLSAVEGNVLDMEDGMWLAPTKWVANRKRRINLRFLGPFQQKSNNAVIMSYNDLLVKVAVPAIAILSTHYPARHMILSTLVTSTAMATAFAYPPYEEPMMCRLVLAAKSMAFAPFACGICAVFVNDESVLWPAWLLYACLAIPPLCLCVAVGKAMMSTGDGAAAATHAYAVLEA